MMQDGTVRAGCQQKLWNYVIDRARWAVKSLLEAFMEHRRDMFCGCASHQRTPARRAYRNGYYERSVEGLLGHLTLRVPRVREAEEQFDPLVLTAYQRRQKQLDEAVLRWVAAGQSTREVSRTVEDIFGAYISAGTVSNIVAQLDSAIRAFHSRPLDTGYRYVYFDAKHACASYLRQTRGRGKKKVVVVLLCWGVHHDGAEELIDFRVADSESAESWTDFMTDLWERGLRRADRWGRRLGMITTDGDQGLRESLWMVYPRVPKQRCIFHKVQNIADHLEQTKHRQAILSEASAIYQGLRSRRQARRRLAAWSKRWEQSEPKAVQRFAYEFEDTLTYLNAPARWRRCVRTTNPIERFIGELTKKIRKVGIFPSARSLERNVYLVWRKLQRQGYGRTDCPNPSASFTQHY